jgi:hypothetical protein
MESISREQEALLARVERLEEARVRLVREMAADGSTPTLSDVARRRMRGEAGRMVSIGMELKGLLSRLDASIKRISV